MKLTFKFSFGIKSFDNVIDFKIKSDNALDVDFYIFCYERFDDISEFYFDINFSVPKSEFRGLEVL